MAKKKKSKKTSIGGQALIEGVMMRGPYKTAMAVRHTSGEIRTEVWENNSKKPLIMRIPVIRGVFNFIDSLIVGYRCLMKSAKMSGMEELEDDGESSPEDLEKQNRFVQKVMPVVTVAAAVLGVGLAVFLFLYLPVVAYDLGVKGLAMLTVLPGGGSRAAADALAEVWRQNGFAKALVTGILKIVIFLCYMLLVSQLKDIKRVFRYHGAEHKTIFCYEHGKPLTVENVRPESRFHPRCGTSFMILMMFVGIAVSLFIPASLPSWLYAAVKLLTLPVVVGIGYELLKLAGRYDNLLTRIISAPGKWMQRITTKEPTDDMIECAITAFLAVVPEDEEADNW